MVTREEILQKERISRLLDPPAGKREEIRKKITDYAESFLNKIEGLPAFIHPANQEDGLSIFPVAEDPLDISYVINLMKTHVDQAGLNPASGGHLGYIPGGGLYYSALGDYLADVFNRYAGIFFAGPGAVRMENRVLGWMNQIMGYPADAVGNLTSGGSIANLIAIVCARDASGLKAREFDKAVIYMTRLAHHSIEKSIRIAGLRECVIRYVDLDENHRMNAGHLDMAIKVDKTNRLVPMMVIASAGTTDTGSVDPLEAIGQVAKRHEIWYHIDAAYGGFFILTDEGKNKLKGIETSDSLVADPHKGLFLPYGTGVVLVKDKKAILQSHGYQAAYMQDALAATEEISPADVSPELTKHFRGLRMWLPLKLHGLKPFRACLEEKLMLAKYFHAEVSRLGFETGPEPDLSVVTYRMVPATGDANEFNKKLLEELHKDGRVFVSSTMLNGKFTLRAAILAFRTHLKTVDLLLEMLKEKKEKLLGS